MWRGCQLCSHTIAAAEKEQALPKVLEWLRKSRQECSITRLLTTPKEQKSAGTKAGKPSQRSRKSKIPVTSYRNRLDEVCAAQNVTVSVDNSPNSSTSVCGTSYSWYDQAPYFSPSPYYSSYPSYLPPMPMSGHSQPSPSSQSLPSTSSWSPVCSPSQMQIQGALLDRPYIVQFLNKRIKKCRGCGTEFSRKIDGSIPDPPNNLVIQHEERRAFTDVNGPRLSRIQNVYYHCALSCVRRINPLFQPSQLIISPS